MKVICISGKAGHGKDTAAEFLKNIAENNGNKVMVTHYADLLKYICKQFFHWDGNKDSIGRHILQYVGTDVIRKQRPDYWVNFIADMMELFPHEWDYVIIPDLRFPNEIDVLKERGLNPIHLRVVRKNYNSQLTKEQQEHPSETALDDTKPDAYIENNGSLEDFAMAIGEWFYSEQNGVKQMTLFEQ